MLKQFLNSNTSIREWYATITVCYSTVIFGITLAFVADLKNDLQGIKLTQQDLATIGSLNLYAATIGNIIVLPLVDKLGRKKCILLTFILQIIAWTLQTFFVFSLSVVYASRLLSGLACGARVVCIVYISEVARKNRRGILICFTGITISIGISLTYIIEYTSSSQVAAVVALVLSIAGLFQTYFLPETKYWHIMTNNDQKAEESSLWFDSTQTIDSIRNEIEEIRRIQNQIKSTKTIWQMLQKRSTLKNIALCVSIMISRAGAGRIPLTIHPIGFYSHFPLPLDVESITFIQGTLDVVFLVCYAFVADRIPRKVTVHIGCCLMNFSLIVVMVNFGFFGNDSAVISATVGSWLNLIFLLTYFLICSTAVFTCTTAIVAEIASASTKSRGVVQCSSFVCFSLYSAVLTQFVPLIWSTVSILFVLAFFFVNVSLLSFVVHRLPETSGKPLHLCVGNNSVTPDTECTKV